MRFVQILEVLAISMLPAFAAGTLRHRYVFKMAPDASFNLTSFDHVNITFGNETFNVANLNASERLFLKSNGADALEVDGLVTTATLNNLTQFNIVTYPNNLKIQYNAPAHLDRINNPGLDTLYSYTYDGAGSLLYILDTGINAAHQDFAPNRVLTKYSFSSYGSLNDIRGHGTATASNAAGMQCGVAKGAKIIPFKIIGDNGYGSIATLLEGFSVIYKQITTVFKNRRVVINLSLETTQISGIIAQAMQKLTDAGAVIVVASGNKQGDSCSNGLAAPSRENLAILSVGALAALDDSRAYFSNSGACTQVYVKGEDILSASNLDNSGYIIKSGTSMAAAIVSGMLAVLWERHGGDDNRQVLQRFLSLAESQTLTYDPYRNGYANPNLIAALPKVSVPLDLALNSYHYAVAGFEVKDWPEQLQLAQKMSANCQYTLSFVINTVPTAGFQVFLSTIAAKNLVKSYVAGVQANGPVSWQTFSIMSSSIVTQINGGSAVKYPYQINNINAHYSFNFVVQNSSQVNVTILVNEVVAASALAPLADFKYFGLAFYYPYTGYFQKLNLLQNCPAENVSPPMASLQLVRRQGKYTGNIYFPANNGQWCLNFKTKGAGPLFLKFNNGQFNLTINVINSKTKKYATCLRGNNASVCAATTKTLFVANAKPATTVKLHFSRQILLFSVARGKLQANGQMNEVKLFIQDDNNPEKVAIAFANGQGTLALSKFSTC